jgi:hypothetical protein
VFARSRLVSGTHFDCLTRGSVDLILEDAQRCPSPNQTYFRHSVCHRPPSLSLPPHLLPRLASGQMALVPPWRDLPGFLSMRLSATYNASLTTSLWLGCVASGRGLLPFVLLRHSYRGSSFRMPPFNSVLGTRVCLLSIASKSRGARLFGSYDGRWLFLDHDEYGLANHNVFLLNVNSGEIPRYRLPNYV